MSNDTTNENASTTRDREHLLAEQAPAAAEEHAVLARPRSPTASANKPSRTEPMRPPTRCTATTSSESSYPNRNFKPIAR